MELHVWPSDFGLPSFNIECLQFMVASKLCAAPINIVYSTKPWNSPSGDFPFFDQKNQANKIVNFNKYVEFLRHHKQDVVLDNDLIPVQQCEFDAYTCLLRQKIYPALLQTIWIDNTNFKTVTHYWYMSQLYFPYHMYYLERQRRKAQAIVQTSRRNPQQLTLDAIQVLNLLSAKLADNKYFCGDKPCSMDALIFGYLAPLLRLPLPNDRLQMHLSSCANLVRFVESIISIYLPLPEAAVRQQLNSKKFWDRRRLDAQKNLEDGRLRREQRRNETENASKDSSFRDTLLFVAGAITLSILFAVHTGMIKFQVDEKPTQNEKRRSRRNY